MNKKLQIFISSTYTDLIEERQAAVQAVLSAGHIPAGMELFTAGDESQQEIIKRWINESDVYMLILGGRYGSLLPDKSKSYTHWEFDYAGEIGKARFALVLTENAIQRKIEKISFVNATEQSNPQMHKEFRDKLLGSKFIKPVDDLKDIEIGVYRSMREIENKYELSGWVSGKDVPDVKSLLEESAKLLRENTKLTNELQKLKDKIINNDLINGYQYEELSRLLDNKTIKLPKEISKTDEEFSFRDIFWSCKDSFALGITNEYGMRDDDHFLFFKLAPTLMSYGLLEKVKVAGVKYERIQTSKEGHKFIARMEVEYANKSNKKKSDLITDENPIEKKSTVTKRQIARNTKKI